MENGAFIAVWVSVTSWGGAVVYRVSHDKLCPNTERLNPLKKIQLGSVAVTGSITFLHLFSLWGTSPDETIIPVIVNQIMGEFRGSLLNGRQIAADADVVWAVLILNH